MNIGDMVESWVSRLFVLLGYDRINETPLEMRVSYGLFVAINLQ